MGVDFGVQLHDSVVGVTPPPPNCCPEKRIEVFVHGIFEMVTCTIEATLARYPFAGFIEMLEIGVEAVQAIVFPILSPYKVITHVHRWLSLVLQLFSSSSAGEVRKSGVESLPALF